MTRAVIKFSGDISPLMPRLARRIDGCAYNEKANLMAFPFKGITVNVESQQIVISHIEDEAMVKTFMAWFVSLVNGLENK